MAELPTLQKFCERCHSLSSRERDWKFCLDLLKDYERWFVEYKLKCFKSLDQLEFDENYH